MCPDCGRSKMLFETERKANDFIKWNGDDIVHTGTLRSYYCPSCCGWHITHMKPSKEYENKTQNLIDSYQRSLKVNHMKKIDHAIASIDFEKEAKKIFDAMSNDIKNSQTKGRIKDYMTDYLKSHGIGSQRDSGLLRGEVYKVWKKHCLDNEIKRY